MPKTLVKIMRDWYTTQSNMYNFNESCFVFGMDRPKSESTIRKRFNKYNFYFDGWVSLDKLNIDNPKINDSVTICDENIYNNEQGCKVINKCSNNLTIIALSKNSTDNCHYKVSMNLPDIKIHDLRHSHVSLLINEGANVQTIADRIGDTVSQVLKTYALLFEKTENELIDILDEAL